jgi:ABC-type bacteriocin/lantibiotic exporter with double-glycine peptidase domain
MAKGILKSCFLHWKYALIRKASLSLFVVASALCVFAVAGRAEVPIAPENRVHRLARDSCGWCALETLARHHGLESLSDVLAKKRGSARAGDLEAVLDAGDVNYHVQEQGSRSTFILRFAVKEKLGAVVAFRELKPASGGHMVTLVDFNDSHVKVIDPNDSDGRVRVMPLSRFLSWWNGYALVIDPEAAVQEGAVQPN